MGSLEREDAFRVEIHTDGEIEELARSFLQMDLELRDYICKLSTITAEKEEILNPIRYIPDLFWQVWRICSTRKAISGVF